MTKTQKRKITVNGVEYEWCIRDNDLWGPRETSITIYRPGSGGRQLYLDPYPWDLEIRPKTIKGAIEYALNNGWVPEDKGKPVYMGYCEGTFVILPEGTRRTHQYQEKTKGGPGKE